MFGLQSVTPIPAVVIGRFLPRVKNGNVRMMPRIGFSFSALFTGVTGWCTHAASIARAQIFLCRALDEQLRGPPPEGCSASSRVLPALADFTMMHHSAVCDVVFAFGRGSVSSRGQIVS